MHHDAALILAAGALLAAGVGASIVTRRIRVPALVLFLGVGLAIGTDGLGWINFDDYVFARLIGYRAAVDPLRGRGRRRVRADAPSSGHGGLTRHRRNDPDRPDRRLGGSS